MCNQHVIRESPLKITDKHQLEELNGLIHDEFFDLDNVSFHKDQRIVEIPYRRIFYDGPSRLIRNWFIFQTVEVDVIRALLTIRNAEDYSFKDSARIGTFSFNKISYDGTVLLFECNESLELRMLVSQIDIESRDIEVRGKARITRGFLWETTSSKVYE